MRRLRLRYELGGGEGKTVSLWKSYSSIMGYWWSLEICLTLVACGA